MSYKERLGPAGADRWTEAVGVADLTRGVRLIQLGAAGRGATVTPLLIDVAS